MRWLIFTVFALVSCSVTPGVSVPNADSNVSIVEALLTKVEDVTDQPGAPRNCLGNSNVCIDGAYRVTFTVLKTLRGPPIDSPLTRTQASAQPRNNLQYILVVSRSANGQEINYAGLWQFGLCMDAEEARTLGIESELAKYPCRRYG